MLPPPPPPPPRPSMFSFIVDRYKEIDDPNQTTEKEKKQNEPPQGRRVKRSHILFINLKKYININKMHTEFMHNFLWKYTGSTFLLLLLLLPAGCYRRATATRGDINCMINLYIYIYVVYMLKDNILVAMAKKTSIYTITQST